MDGHPVEYVGSAVDLKQRLMNGHHWNRLLQAREPRVFAKEILAELNVPGSNRGTLLSARNEALRAAEQQVIEEVRQRAAELNRTRPAGAREVTVLNEIDASTNPTVWASRHKVNSSAKWRVFERPGVNLQAKAFVLMSLWDAYLLALEAKKDGYLMADYILEDEQGLFSIAHDQKSWFSGQTYYKIYVGGKSKGLQIEVSGSEFEGLQAEAEALWGKTDAGGDFVPGLFNRELREISKPGSKTVL